MTDYLKLTKKYIKDKRLEHSISTANMMREHAAEFQIDPQKAYISGLVHDVARGLNERKMLKYALSFIERKIIKVKNLGFKLKHPMLLHGVASAEIIFIKFGITQKEILESACTHTLGGKKLSPLAQYTFMADYCEPLRNNATSKKIYRILIEQKKFQQAYFYTYYYMIQYLLKKKKTLSIESIRGYNEALLNLQHRNN